MKNVLKKKWGKPVTEVQQFTPQEFVALCATCEIGHGIVNTGPQINNTSNFLHSNKCSPVSSSTNVSQTGTIGYGSNQITVYVWFSHSSGLSYYHAATTADNHS